MDGNPECPAAPCGLFCGACDVYLANLGGTVQELAKEWGRPPEDLMCLGCLSPETAIYCRNCGIRDCAVAKKFVSCADCPEMPCKLLKDFAAGKIPHHQTILVNLERIREAGLDAWISEQTARWTCACGKRFSWYQENCPACGAGLRSMVQEARDIKEK
jgi:hypothetical protein